MSAGKRAARALIAATLCLVLLGALSATAVAATDEARAVDVAKTVDDLHKKWPSSERGRNANRGELSATAVCEEDEADPIFSPSATRLSTPRRWRHRAAGNVDGEQAHAPAENSPFGQGAASLFLGDHGEAISPAMCVSVAHPTIRLFAANTGDEESRLEVEILYEGLDGKIKKLAYCVAAPGPTSVVPVHVNMLGAAFEDGLTAIAVKFKAKDVKEKDAGWKIDDLYVDPMKVW